MDAIKSYFQLIVQRDDNPSRLNSNQSIIDVISILLFIFCIIITTITFSVSETFLHKYFILVSVLTLPFFLSYAIYFHLNSLVLVFSQQPQTKDIIQSLILSSLFPLVTSIFLLFTQVFQMSETHTQFLILKPVIVSIIFISIFQIFNIQFRNYQISLIYQQSYPTQKLQFNPFFKFISDRISQLISSFQNKDDKPPSNVLSPLGWSNPQKQSSS